jgi:hypothetical protein
MIKCPKGKSPSEALLDIFYVQAVIIGYYEEGIKHVIRKAVRLFMKIVFPMNLSHLTFSKLEI